MLYVVAELEDPSVPFRILLMDRPLFEHRQSGLLLSIDKPPTAELLQLFEAEAMKEARIVPTKASDVYDAFMVVA